MHAMNRSFGMGLVVLAVAASGAFVVGQRTVNARTEVSAAQASATPVAIVDLERVMQGLKEREARESAMRTSINERQKELDTFNRRLEALGKQFEATPRTDIAAIRKLRQDQVETTAQARVRQEILKELISQETGEILRSLYLKINDAVSRIATKDGWQLVLLDNRSISIPEQVTDREVNFIIQSRTVLHATSSIDITDDVITLMNSEYR